MKMKRERKKKESGRGRKEGSGVLSGIKPWSEEWLDIRNRLIYGSAEWRILKLRQLIGDGSQLPDNYLSARTGEIQISDPPKVTMQDLDQLWNKLRKSRKGQPPSREDWLDERDKLYKAKTGKPYKPEQPDEIAWLWCELAGQFQRAVLKRDADWFTLQAKAIRWNDKRTKSQMERARFNAKVLDLFEHAMWWTHAKQRDDRESLTLTPAGKFTDSMASDIYNALEKHELPNGHLIVAGCRFESKERVREAIHDLAKQLQFALRKQH